MSDRYRIHHVPDAFAVLRSMQDGSVDHVITDPPYDEHCQANMMSGTTFKQYVNGELESKTGIPKVEMHFDALPGYDFARDLVRVARRWSIAFCTVEDFGEYKRSVGPAWVRGGIWAKKNAMGQLTGDRPAAAYEGLAIMHAPGKKRWNGRGSYGIWAANGTRGEKGRHPNQKPLDLCLKLVDLFTDPDEVVFDPFCGSARIGEACMLLGRRYVGLDFSAEWAARAEVRLAEAAKRWGEMLGKLDPRLCAAFGHGVSDSAKVETESPTSPNSEGHQEHP